MRNIVDDLHNFAEAPNNTTLSYLYHNLRCSLYIIHALLCLVTILSRPFDEIRKCDLS